MGSCCSSSDTAASPRTTTPLAPGRVGPRAAPSTDPQPLSRAPFLGLASVDASRKFMPGETATSLPQAHATRGALDAPATSWKEAPKLPTPTAGPPAAQADRETSFSPPLHSTAALRSSEKEAFGDSDSDAFSEPEPLQTKGTTTVSAENQKIAPPQPLSEDDTDEESTSSVSATPESAMARTSAPREEHTRGQSTAQVYEVPPTPKGENEQTLPADDTRVLQRVPPPPPPPPLAGSTVSMNRKEEDSDDEVFDIREPHEGHLEAPGSTHHDPPIAAKSVSDEALEQVPEPHPLTENIYPQQEMQQHCPTAPALDTTETAPLHIHMGEAASQPTEATKRKPSGATPVPPEVADSVNMGNNHRIHAVQETPMVGALLSETMDNPTSEIVYKILRHEEWLALKGTGKLWGTSLDGAGSYMQLTTAEQAPKVAEDLYADETRLTLLACSTKELSQEAPGSMDEEKMLEGPPLRWETSSGENPSPRLYRPLDLKTDVLWRKECANAAEVAEKINDVVVYSDFVFGEEGEVTAQVAADILRRDAEKPNVLTTTDELGAVGEHRNASQETTLMEKDCVYTIGNADVEGKPEPVEMSEVPLDLPVVPIETSDEPIANPEHHADPAVQAAEHFVSDDAEAPRRLPPPLPSPEEDDGLSAQLSSLSAPLSMMSPPPGL